MKQYLKFLKYIQKNGEFKNDRTIVGTYSIFGYEMSFDISQCFPLITTKEIHIHSVITELLWFLRGETSIDYLIENKVSIWNEWADKDKNLGPVYGKQWRFWECKDGRVIDQIQDLVENIKRNPDSRRLIVSAWNVGDICKMALPPCHMIFQFYVSKNRLSCKLTQRSADAFLGVPFNIASYSLLTYMIAQQCDLQPGNFIWSGGDCHIYTNHLKQVQEQLSRTPFPSPKLTIKRKPASIFSYRIEDFEFKEYQAHPNIKAPIAV